MIAQISLRLFNVIGYPIRDYIEDFGPIIIILICDLAEKTEQKLESLHFP